MHSRRLPLALLALAAWLAASGLAAACGAVDLRVERAGAETRLRWSAELSVGEQVVLRRGSLADLRAGSRAAVELGRFDADGETLDSPSGQVWYDASCARPSFLDVVPNHFGFGVSSFGGVLDWPGDVEARTDIEFDYLYWYQLKDSSMDFLSAKLQRARNLGAMPVITHYQLLDRGREAGYTGAEEWDVVIQAVQDPVVMRGYYDNVQAIMERAAAFGDPAVFQTEPDSSSWLRMFHTEGTNDARQGPVAVASSGHPDLLDLPNDIAGHAQALVRLRDRYAGNVFIGWCAFDNRNGANPEYEVTYLQSLGTQLDLLFTHHVVKYSTRGEGWWDAYDDPSQQRFLTWIQTITQATGLSYIHWQTVIGASDYGLMPDYPTQERISALVAAGSIGNLFDLYTLDGPPHSQPWHGYTASPAPDHPAYNSLDKLEERLERYYAAPIPLR